MRIYPAEFSIAKIKDECRVHRKSTVLPLTEDRLEPVIIDLKLLNEKLKKMPIDEIRQRRNELNVFYAEVLHSADPDRGINFTALLMILAHYKIINDNKSLRLEEFLRRRRRLQYVEEDIQRAIVRNSLDMLYHKLKFRRFQAQKQAGRIQTVPELYLEDYEEYEPAMRKGPPALTISIPPLSPSSTAIASGISPDLGSPTTMLRQRGESIFDERSPTTSPNRPSFGALSPQLSPGNTTLQTPGNARTYRSISEVSAPTAGTLGLGPTPFDGPPSPLHENGTLTTYQGARLGDDLPHIAIHQGDTSDDNHTRSRASSYAAPQGMWEALEDTAWGASIRRSFSRRNVSGESQAPPSPAGTGLGLGAIGGAFGLSPVGGGTGRMVGGGTRRAQRPRRVSGGRESSGRTRSGTGSSVEGGVSGNGSKGRPHSWYDGA